MSEDLGLMQDHAALEKQVRIMARRKLIRKYELFYDMKGGSVNQLRKNGKPCDSSSQGLAQEERQGEFLSREEQVRHDDRGSNQSADSKRPDAPFQADILRRG